MEQKYASMLQQVLAQKQLVRNCRKSLCDPQTFCCQTQLKPKLDKNSKFHFVKCRKKKSCHVKVLPIRMFQLNSHTPVSVSQSETLN